jgi:Zn-dependent M32 family carboxypeptidase
VHSLGARRSPDDLVEQATGAPLSTTAWTRYVEEKLGDLELARR